MIATQSHASCDAIAARSTTSTCNSELTTASTKEEIMQDVAKRLASGQHILARMRSRMSVTFFLLGTCCLVGFILVERHAPWRSGMCAEDKDVRCFYVAIASVLWTGRIVFWASAPMYDKCMMRLVIVIEAVVATKLAYTLAYGYLHVEMMRGPSKHIFFLCLVAFLVGHALPACTQSARQMQMWMWRVIFMRCCFCIIFFSVWAWYSSVKCGSIPFWYFVWLPASLFLVGFATRPSRRQQFHRDLSTWFEGRSQAQAAAAVASLVGSCSTEEVMQLASARFRYVELSALSPRDFADNTPDMDLYSKSAPTSLSECDAFISHSWHDDAEAKWAALQEWRQHFILQHAREPRVWIDKCCIDQASIVDDLLCLPVFLGGCQKLVVLCGPTYLHRLWCIVEVFTFAHMGRALENLELKIVLREGRESEDLCKVEASLDEFNAAQCDCHAAEDKERMLGIIYASFGSIQNFNRDVRSILCNARWKDICIEHVQTLKQSPAVTAADKQLANFMCGPDQLDDDSLV